MKNKAEPDRKQRKRKIEGLSIFDSEIAAPSDYGDFMRVDAPVSLRESKDPSPVVPVAPPSWERFMDAEDAERPAQTHESDTSSKELGTNSVQEHKSLETQETGYKASTELTPSPSIQVQSGYSNDELSHSQKVGTKRVLDQRHNTVDDGVQTGYNRQSLPATASPMPQEPADTAQQSGYKLGTEIGTDPVQTGHKEGTEPSETRYTASAVDYKVGTQSGTEEGTESVQTRYKKTFATLRGVQRKVVLFLFENSLSNRSKSTGPIAIEHLALSCETSINTAKVSIKRLKKEGLVEKVEFGNGRGGWTRYALPDSVFNEILQERNLGTNSVHTGYRPGIQPGTQLSTSGPSSSSLEKEDLLKTTTQETLPQEWEEIDYSFLAGDPIRFGKRDIVTVYKLGTFKAQDIQNTLREFHFDITHNKKQYGRGALFGVLRKGNLWLAAGYESEEDRAIREQVKILQARTSSRQELREKLEELQFQEWVSGLSADEKKALSPYSQNESSPMFLMALKSHFREQVMHAHNPEEVRTLLDRELGPSSPVSSV